MESSKICAEWGAGHSERVTAQCGLRGAFSLLSGVAWLSFVIIWLFFYVGEYSIWENIGVVLLMAMALLWLARKRAVAGIAGV